MTDLTKITVAKLNGENYFTWKYKMELLLIKENLWSMIDETKPVLDSTSSNRKQVADWQKRDDQARAMIGLLVEDSQLSLIRTKVTAADTWSALKEYHEKDSLGNKVSLMRRICSSKLDEGGNLEAHISEVTDLFQKLTDLGEEKLSERWMVAMILSSLPRSYDTLVTALEARSEADLTLSLIKSKLIDEYYRRKETNGTDNTVLSAMQSKLACFFCKRYGHVKRDCRKYKSWKEKKDKEDKGAAEKTPGGNKANKVDAANEFLFMVSPHTYSDWIIDSGATSHVTGNKSYFASFEEISSSSLDVANGEKVQVRGKGTCNVKLINSDGTISSAAVTDVLYAPQISGSLLSVRKLNDKGYTVNFSGNFCEIVKDKRQVAIGEASGSLYKLCQPHKVHSVEQHKLNCIHHWHRVFGHRDPDAIKNMCSKQMVDDIKICNCGIKILCEVCLQAKTTRLPFPRWSSSKSTTVLDLIHSDVCGPVQTTSPSGKRYVLTFIDDYSRYTVVYFLREKSEVEIKIKEYVEMVKNKFSKRPKIIRSDRGGEYVNKGVTEYLKTHGIQIQYTAPYTPQQNGVAERKNRSLFEMARCMLLDADLTYTFWAEAVNTANYLQNRLPSRAIKTTPFEKWNGTKAKVKHTQIFGLKCFVHIPEQRRRKLDSVAKPMIFIGYDDNSKAYRCYDPALKKVVVSRDVRFTNTKMSDKESEANADSPTMSSQSETDGHPSHLSKSSVSQKGNTQETPTDDEDEEEKGKTTADEVDEERDPQHETPRTSNRLTKGVPPQRLAYDALKVINGESDPKTMTEILSSKDKAQWIQAMDEEMESLRKNETWRLCKLPDDRTAIGCKWVYKTKTDAEGNVTRFKARLVAQGFSQKYGTDYDQVFAPVARQATFRTLLAIASKEKYIVRHLDFKSAFLNGELKEEIYMNQPPGFVKKDKESLVCLLQKGLYGLKQAARSWYDELNKVLTKADFTQSSNDPCFYVKKDDGWCYLIIYVDDIIVAAKTNETINKIKTNMSSYFETKDLGNVKLYLGIEVLRDENGLYHLCQSKYIQKVVAEFGLQDAKASNIPMSMGYLKNRDMDNNLLLSNKIYQKLIGCLLYISVNTRPDISASVSILAQSVSQPRQEDWNELKRVLKYLKGTAHYKLALGNNESANELLYGYSDASWAENKRDRKSHSGYAFLINGALVSWGCRKQGVVALSTMEAEFIALSEACKEALWLRRLLGDMQQTERGPTKIYEDNQSCLRFIETEKLSNQSKHIDTKVKFVKNYVDRGVVLCEYCPTEEMLADLLTKPLPLQRLEKLREIIGIHQ